LVLIENNNLKEINMGEENNKENTEVEDILSSIKNILEEVKQDPIVEKKELPSDDALADDDIIELSADMRIVQEEISDNKEELSDNNDLLKISDIKIDDDNVQLDDLINDGDANSDNVLSELLNEVEQQEEPINHEIINEDNITEQKEIIDNEIQNLIVDSNPIADTLPEIQNDFIEEDTRVENQNSVELESADDKFETSEEVCEVLDNKEEKLDASANIISNFAKIFAKENKDNVVDKKPVIEGLGNGSKTLESFVSDAIVKVIGDEILKHWDEGKNFESIVKMEIEKQVKEWINNNFTQTVEKIIKEELEKMIEKNAS
jgi:hypothetical protein